MRTQSQALMIALAIVFTVALALTVALICLNSAQKELSGEVPTLPPTDPDTALPTLPTAAVTESLPTAELGNGLFFRSIGNGCCTLESIGTCRDAFVVIPEYSPAGERVTSVSDKALMGCETVTAIQIPDTVWSIGELAFADCPNLIYISVSESNSAYCDREGVLYTADGRTLLLYPPLHAGNSLYLSPEVTAIAEMAFYRCAYLTGIRYGGTAEQWERIAIGAKNYSLTAASVVYAVKG